ncbi:MAG TPA: YtxH domain-containing protein, partial [Terriglobia bacterium]|nr:YtxH domain-containing protein [Terriglobia bacterium]
MNKAIRVLIMLGAGAALGATAGLLYAPESGRRTRRRLRRAMDRGLDRVEALQESVTDRVSDIGIAGTKRF